MFTKVKYIITKDNEIVVFWGLPAGTATSDTWFQSKRASGRTSKATQPATGESSVSRWNPTPRKTP
jgi:hypothetical protein